MLLLLLPAINQWCVRVDGRKLLGPVARVESAKAAGGWLFGWLARRAN